MNTAIKFVFLFSLLLLTGCASYCRIDGPYVGKVVDAETKQPLEGVVVLGVWNKVQFTVAGPTGSFYDSIEVLTDKNGEFRIPGQGLLLLSNVDEMNVLIFKAGFERRGYGPWSNFKTRTGSRNIQWDGDKPTFLLRKLNHEERREHYYTMPNIPQARMKLMINEINKARLEFGLKPF